MSTKPEQSQASAPAPEETFDDLTGVYGWFRRHQKKLLYTAGLFTLLTFSVTGPLQSWISGIFVPKVERGTIVVDGERVQLTSDDYRYGALIARNMRVLQYRFILPVTNPGLGGGDGELSEVLAILRRAAITEGFEPSMIEVDKAIEAMREQRKSESAAQLAVSLGFSSRQEFRLLAAEALRIGIYQRLQLVALNSSDAEVMRQVLRNREKIAYRVAVWDAEKRQETMVAESKLTDEELKAWLDEQNEMQQRRMGVFALPRVKLRIGAAMLGDGQFDGAQWKDGVLQDAMEIGEDQLRAYYDGDTDRWKDADGNARAFEDEAVQKELLQMAQAQQVMNDLNTKLRTRLDEVAKPFVEKVSEAQTDFDSAKEARQKTLQEKLTKEKVLKKSETDLAAAPEDADLQAAVAAAKAEAEAAGAADFAEEQRLQQMEAGIEAAKAEETKARIEFDFAGELATLTEEKSGFVTKETAELFDSEQLADLEALGLGLGEWSSANAATSISVAGQMGFGAAGTTKAAIIYQVVEADPTPLKPWEELKPLLQESYYSEKATEECIAKDKAIKEVLLRMAKEQMADFIQEQEGGRQALIDERMTAWETGVKAEIAKAEQTLKTPGMGANALKQWQQHLDIKQKELATRPGKQKEVEGAVDKEITAAVKTEAMNHYKTVMDAAAAEVGYEIVEVGPYSQELSSRPRFAESYDKITRYLFSWENEMDEGDAIGPIYTSMERASYVVVCTQLTALESADVTRRQFEAARASFDIAQMSSALMFSFSQEDLSERYSLEKPVGDQFDPQ